MVNVQEISVITILIVSGSAKTIFLKFIDKEYSIGYDNSNHHFFHPFLETVMQMLGEALCLCYYGAMYGMFKAARDDVDEHFLTAGNRKIKFKFIIIPNILHIIGTTLHFVGLFLTYASSFQIFRGTVLIFVPLFSRCLLNQSFDKYQNIAMSVMVMGLIFCGLSDYISEAGHGHQSITNYSRLIGDVLIVIGEIFHSVQIVMEEEHMRDFNIPPLFYVGVQGCIGVLVTGLLLIPLQFIPDPWMEKPRAVLQDTHDAFIQMQNNSILVLFICFFIVCSSFYYCAMLMATKLISSVTTVVFVTTKAVIVWVFGITLFKEDFHIVQLMGFSLFIVGILAYNNLIPMHLLARRSINLV